SELFANLIKFENTETIPHSVYGYLFLKYLSRLGDCAETILYHHLAYAERGGCRSDYRELALKLHLADRVDICAMGESSDRLVIETVERYGGEQFDPADIELFKAADKKFGVIRTLRGGGCEEDVRECYRGRWPFPRMSLWILFRRLYSR
ncbi:MAG: hypothetical protein LIO38_01000, partial [Cloacibacillus sp.]|nr:hypothetical protein [Cloacibacillus sp.]